jgi:hypothetical protein
MGNPVDIQREYFSILDEFFKRATGEEATRFARSTDEFGVRIRRDAHSLSVHACEAFEWFYPEITSFYQKQKTATFLQAKQVGGLKYVMGGASRFTETHFNSVRKILLYADTILIPDPILPWIESSRTEERFRDVLLLQEAFSLLRLKPLVDANTAYPAIHVFQSYEKSLQDHDQQTIDGIYNLTMGIVGSFLGHDFGSFNDLHEFIKRNPDDYLSGIEQHNLFIAPGQKVVGKSLQAQISEYRDEIRRWRTKEYIYKFEKLSPVELVTNGMIERFTHQYHLMENAEELAANPMISIPQQWHYFELCAHAIEHRLVERGVMSEEAVRTIRALEVPGLAWLGDIHVTDLVRLREANENEELRKHLDTHIHQLHGASAGDLNRIASQISRAIASLIAKHNNEVTAIQRKYSRSHTQTAVSAWITAAATFSPILGPFAGTAAAPLAVLGKYAWDKYNELQDLKQASQSLMGIFAKTERSVQQRR